MSPEQAAPPTAAQAACEAFWAEIGAGPDGQPADAAWRWAGKLNARAAWEAAAKAVAPALTGLLAGARQLRDEAMDEAENLREERDRLTERVAELVTEGNELREEVGKARDALRMLEVGKARDALRMLASIVHADVLVMEAAAIEMRRGDTHAAMQWILNAMPDCWDGEPGTEWNGRETAQEWFDRQPGVQDEQPGLAVITAGTEHLAAAIARLAIGDEEG